MYAKTQRQRQIQTTLGLELYAESMVCKIGITEGEKKLIAMGL